MAAIIPNDVTVAHCVRIEALWDAQMEGNGLISWIGLNPGIIFTTRLQINDCWLCLLNTLSWHS